MWIALTIGRRPTSTLSAGRYSISPVASSVMNAVAWTQCTPRSVRVNRSIVSESIRVSDPRVRVVAALLPVAGLGVDAEGDALDPLDALVAVHLGNHHAHRRPVLARERLAVHLVGEHGVAESGLVERERVDVRLLRGGEREDP